MLAGKEVMMCFLNGREVLEQIRIGFIEQAIQERMLLLCLQLSHSSVHGGINQAPVIIPVPSITHEVVEVLARVNKLVNTRL